VVIAGEIPAGHLKMKRDTLKKINRKANERPPGFGHGEGQLMAFCRGFLRSGHLGLDLGSRGSFQNGESGLKSKEVRTPGA
jgi:hypothetical protein